MKALFELFRRFDARRLFGFIRRLGGHVTSKSQVLRFAFYPRPLGGRRHQGISQKSNRVSDFYPRPPGGGRPRGNFHGLYIEIFLSTPSGWRATKATERRRCDDKNFYPRPPGGGRPILSSLSTRQKEFLSTPSGWRATMRDHHAGLRRGISIHALRVEGDMNELLYSLIEHISIHALRVEGDRVAFCFYP